MHYQDHQVDAPRLKLRNYHSQMSSMRQNTLTDQMGQRGQQLFVYGSSMGQNHSEGLQPFNTILNFETTGVHFAIYLALSFCLSFLATSFSQIKVGSTVKWKRSLSYLIEYSLKVSVYAMIMITANAYVCLAILSGISAGYITSINLRKNIRKQLFQQ